MVLCTSSIDNREREREKMYVQLSFPRRCARAIAAVPCLTSAVIRSQAAPHCCTSPCQARLPHRAASVQPRVLDQLISTFCIYLKVVNDTIRICTSVFFDGSLVHDPHSGLQGCIRNVCSIVSRGGEKLLRSEKRASGAQLPASALPCATPAHQPGHCCPIKSLEPNPLARWLRLLAGTHHHHDGDYHERKTAEIIRKLNETGMSEVSRFYQKAFLDAGRCNFDLPDACTELRDLRLDPNVEMVAKFIVMAFNVYEKLLLAHRARHQQPDDEAYYAIAGLFAEFLAVTRAICRSQESVLRAPPEEQDMLRDAYTEIWSGRSLESFMEELRLRCYVLKLACLKQELAEEKRARNAANRGGRHSHQRRRGSHSQKN